MYRFVGIILVSSAFFGFLYSKGQTIGRKYENLKEMIKALTYLKQEISFSSGELFRVCRDISLKTHSDISEVFCEISNILEEKPMDFYSAWLTSTNKKTLFAKEVKTAVCDLAQNLGKKSLDIELENIEKTKQILEQIEEYEKEKTAKDKKLLYTLGASVGAAFLILVI